MKSYPFKALCLVNKEKTIVVQQISPAHWTIYFSELLEAILLSEILLNSAKIIEE